MKRRNFIKLVISAPILLKLGCSKEESQKLLLENIPKSFDFLEVKGTYREIGLQIGRKTGGTLKLILDERKEWFNNLMQIANSSEGEKYAKELLDNTRNLFPQYAQEVEGMAIGAGIDFKIMWALTIKNELSSFANLEAGCSTIYYKEDGKTWLFHNEDGDAAYFNRMLMLKAITPSGVNFYSLAYPGIISGVGPSINSQGICQTTNYISCINPKVGIPRYIIGRSVLESKNMAEAIETITVEPRAYPWHHNILSLNNSTFASIETLPDGKVDASYPEGGIFVHTNHAIGRTTENYYYQNKDYIKLSSNPRLQSLQKLISSADFPASNPEKFIRFLSSHEGEPYSLCRHPVIYKKNEPVKGSEEKKEVRGQTLATAFFDCETKKMRIYKGNPCKALMKENYNEYSF